MKQSLQLNIGQHLTMTPQLQQAIRLLQLSTLELQAEVQQALESNPLLEMADEGGEEGASSPAAGEGGEFVASGETAAAERTAELEASEPDAGEPSMQMTDIPDELPVDSNWDDIYDTALPNSSSGMPDDDERGYESQDTSSEGLREHLDWQMRLMPMTDTDRAIAEAIIDSISDDGYLVGALEDIRLGLEMHAEVEMDEVEAVLHQIQHFDPPGVGARDLKECLLLQLRQIPAETPWREQAIKLVADHLDALAGHDYAQIMRRMKISQDELRQINDVIQTLNPRPGNRIAKNQAEYIVPDVVVRKIRGAWRVELNVDAMPRLRVNSQYASLIRRADSSADNTYLKNQLQEARWLIKSLQSRNETLLKVASCIVERQRGFLEHGEEAMKALVLHDIAETVGMHESTISRVTTNKYMHTPRGIFELKYFFSSHVATAAGGACSATAIRALIKKLVAAEHPAKPLSDSKLASILIEQGINVARRTITKYREGLSIPPSNERKRLS